jgi:flagellar protein FlaG
MEFDLINNNGFQGSSTRVDIKPVLPKSSDSINDVVITEEAAEGNIGEGRVNQVSDITSNEVKKIISEINAKLNKNTEAVFGIHEKTNRITIKIIDKDSKEIIKEIPPEKTLEMIAKIWEVAGLLVDEKL